MTTRADLQRLYDECTRSDPRRVYYRDDCVGDLVTALGDFLAGDDPSVEVAYLRAKVADLEAERDKLRGDSGKVVSDRIEIVNWYATRRHYAGAGAADSGARWWALCGKTIGFSVESDSARRREHGWRQPDYAALPLCKFCERKAAAEDGAES